jgi:hypothetical protein
VTTRTAVKTGGRNSGVHCLDAGVPSECRGPKMGADRWAPLVWDLSEFLKELELVDSK